MAIIKSLLENDLYTFTVGQLALHQCSTSNVTYEFKCRNKDIIWTTQMALRIKREIDQFCKLRFTQEELDYLSSIRFISDDYVSFLKLYQPDRSMIKVEYANDSELSIKITGPWYLTIFFEVPVLAIVNEVYFDYSYITDRHFASGKERLDKKINLIKDYPNFVFSDFGMRRRYNSEWQYQVIRYLVKNCPNFAGTSNVFLAMKYHIKAIGTFSHQLIMAGAGQPNVQLVKSQQFMLQKWVDEYRGANGIALTDTYGVDAFLKDFDLYFAKLYDGVRHDSGDPIVWGEKIINHYKNLRIDPKTKTLVFSDGLDFEKALAIYNHFKDRARLSFGIGTNLMNDFEDTEPLNIVIKPIEFNGKPVAKISDSKGKGMCHDPEFLAYAKKVFNIKD